MATEHSGLWDVKLHKVYLQKLKLKEKLFMILLFWKNEIFCKVGR